MINLRSKLQKRRWAEQKGHLAESLSAFILSLKGYRILKRRFRCALGEIDLIAQKRNMLIMAEVKNRKTLDQALESVSFSQKKRIERASRIFLSQNPKLSGHNIRFDIILLIPWKWKHIENAWYSYEL